MLGPEVAHASFNREQILKLTSQDLNRHQRALVRLQDKLFGKYRIVEDYSLIPESLTIISPSVSFLVLGSEVVRTLSLGGVTYEINCPSKTEKLKLTISHKDKSVFGVFITVTTEQASFQRIATTVEFLNLDEFVLSCVKTALQDYTRQINFG